MHRSPLTDVPTPALVVDLPTVDRNIQRMAQYTRRHRIALRPHMKTHKTRMIGQLQCDAGAVGLTCAKTGEAQVMADVTSDLLIAYPTVDRVRSERAAELARDHHMRVALDSAKAAESLAAACRAAGSEVGVLVDWDIGYHRTGVQSIPDALALAETIERSKSLRLDGLFIYPGHIAGAVEQQREHFEVLEEQLQRLKTTWAERGWPEPVISSGSSPTAYQSHFAPSVTEIRPGTYVYNDMNLVRGGYCTLDDCAAHVEATVVSNTVPGQVVLDSGSKTLTSDLCGPAPDSGYGYLPDYPDARIARLTEEHGQVDVSNCPHAPLLGERVRVIPNHICVCVNMQNAIWYRDTDGNVTAHAVDARGLLV